MRGERGGERKRTILAALRSRLLDVDMSTGDSGGEGSGDMDWEHGDASMRGGLTSCTKLHELENRQRP